MNTQNRITKWSVILGIVIVLNLFFNYALSLVYESPRYEAYCPTTQVVTVPDNQERCVAEGGQWTENAYYGKPAPVRETEPLGYCNLHYTCGQEFNAASETYNRNVFVMLVFLGALSVFLGNYLKGNDVISNGFALGGVLSFIVASMRYWRAADDLIRVIILAIALAILFWIAMRKFRNGGIRS